MVQMQLLKSSRLTKCITTKVMSVALLTSYLLLIACIDCRAQRTKIDSLKHILPGVSKQQRVDCLNTLSLVFSYLDGDTAQSYEEKAFAEAHAIQYARGEVVALNNKARIVGNVLRDFVSQESICRQTIHQYSSITDKNVLCETHLILALSLFNQSKFELSKESCNTVIEISTAHANRQRLGEAIVLKASISFEIGDYQKAFESYNESLSIFADIKDSYNTAIVLTKIGDLNRLAGDAVAASKLYYQSLKFKKGLSLVWHPLVDLGDSYYSTMPTDSALYENDTLQTIKFLTISSNNIAFDRIGQAERYIIEKDYNGALGILNHDLPLSKKRNDLNYAMRLLLSMATVYERTQDYRNGISSTRQLLKIASEHHVKLYLQNGYALMYRMYDKLKAPDSAYAYFKRYTEMKNAVALDAFSKSLAIYKAKAENEKVEAQVELMSNAKQINDQKLKIREQELSGQSFQKNILIGAVSVLLLLGLILMRNNSLKRKNDEQERRLIEQKLNMEKLESEKTKRDLQQHALALEMKALRAQMNPHFIYNSLNSINRYILQNNKNLASDYLTKFSKLIRIILQNSQYTSVTLESEIESLKLYLTLETDRFDNHFEFLINIEEGVDTALKLPPLILQPYVENAIWHGLMHKEEKGLLKINIFEDGLLLVCQITDNGIGRKKSSEIKSPSVSQHRSMGMSISADRIALLHQGTELVNYVVTTDLILPDGSSGGTEVCLKIPIRYD